jgi:hypothetical protein
MSTITAILEPSPDGTLHLPLPPELRHGKVEVTATLKPVAETSREGSEREASNPLRGFGCLKGQIETASDFDEPLEEFREYME